MQFQSLLDPIGTGLALDKQHIANQAAIEELASKKEQRAIQNQTRQALATLAEPTPQQQRSIADANDLDAQIKFIQGDYDDFSKKARVLQAVNPEAAKPFQEAADKRLTLLKDLQGKKIVEQEKRTKQIEGISGLMMSEDTFNEGVQMMNAVAPGLLAQAGFQQDPENGMFLPTPENMRKAKAMNERSLTAMEKQTLASRTAEIENKRIDNNRADEEARRRKFDADREYALKQQKLELDKEEAARKRTEAKEKGGVKDAMKLSTQYRKETKEFDEVIKRVYSVAADYVIDPKTGKMKDSSQITPAGDNALALAYVQSTNPKYRGSVAEIRALEKFEGIPEKTFQAVKNVFNGKELSPDVRKEMFEVVRRTFVVANKQQQEVEENLRAQLRKSNPDLTEDDIELYIPKRSIGSSQKFQEGVVYTDAKGNRAKYVNGKWVPE